LDSSTEKEEEKEMSEEEYLFTTKEVKESYTLGFWTGAIVTFLLSLALFASIGYYFS
jgi:hypothetical protein